jgi:hypothetical protein
VRRKGIQMLEGMQKMPCFEKTHFLREKTGLQKIVFVPKLHHTVNEGFSYGRDGASLGV